MKSTNNDFEMSILVGHKPIPEYSHANSIFIEGRNGSEYKIRVRNNTYRRACFVVSVDGLSVLNGKECSDDSPGYILGSHETLDILCYKVDDATGAKFVFGTKDKSYSAEIGKGTDNVGVIAMKVFREKQYQQPITIRYDSCFPPQPRYGSSVKSASVRSKVIGSSGAGRQSGWGNITLNDQGMNSSPSFTTTNTSAGIVGGSLGHSMDDEGLRGMMPTDAVADEAGLGTVFGDAMSWETKTVMFDREVHVDSQMVIYYDTRKNLERRGVRLEQKVPPLPNPFPGNNGCATPHGWRR